MFDVLEAHLLFFLYDRDPINTIFINRIDKLISWLLSPYPAT